jgi:serine/threonine-protein kinase
MVQKDPRYRYQSAREVAEVLEKFAALVPRGTKVTSGLGAAPEFDEDGSSSISLDRTKEPSTGHGDTISNKGEDTLASARSALIRGKGLSAGDSGRLVEIKPRHDLIEGSFLDLQLESGYRANSGVAQRVPAGRNGTGRDSSERDASQAVPSERDPARPGRRADATTRSVSSRSGIRLDADAERTLSRDEGSSSGRLSRSKRRQALDPMLIGALITALFIVALAMGFFLARITG